MRVSNIVAVAGLAVIGAGSAWAGLAVPHQRPGLWATDMAVAGQPMKTQSCVTVESEAKMSVFSSQSRQKNCSSSSVTHNMDGSWTSTSTCKFGLGAARTTHARISGDFGSKLTLVVTNDGSTKPETTMTMVWLGACKPGMKGGDVVMSNGMKINVIDGTMSGVPQH